MPAVLFGDWPPEPLLRETVEHLTRILGASHPQTLNAIYNQGCGTEVRTPVTGGDMTRNGRLSSFVGSLVVLMLVAPGRIVAQDAPTPPVRAIPGITAADPFPQACVSCHVVLPDGVDVRLSTLVKGWMRGADSLLLRKAQSAAPAGLTLTGMHPDASKALSDIPAGCLTCHGSNATLAPPFTRLIHRIHLTGGESNHFLSMFQGECTLCHKLDLTSGAWSIPSAPEP